MNKSLFDTIITTYHFDEYLNCFGKYFKIFQSVDLDIALSEAQGALVINSIEYLDVFNLSNMDMKSSFRVYGYFDYIKDTGQDRVYPHEDHADCADYFLDTGSYVLSLEDSKKTQESQDLEHKVLCPIVKELKSPDSYSRAVFLDRDGVINIDHGYVYEPAKLEFIEGVTDFLKECQRSDILKLVVTNQAGVARGLFSEKEVAEFHQVICDRLKDQGVIIDGIEIAPYHFKNGHGDYKKHSFTRKPGIAMVFKHLYRFHVDLSSSWMIGDKPSDILNIDLLNYLLLRGEYNLSPYDNMIFDSFEEIKTYLFSLDFLHQA